MEFMSMKRGEIWLVNFSPNIGAEIGKIRPAVVINDNDFGKLPLKIILPITDWKDRYEFAIWLVKITPNSINNLTKDSAIDCFQIKSVSTERFVKKIGQIDAIILEKTENALNKVLKINY